MPIHVHWMKENQLWKKGYRVKINCS
jgi:hypothetical protein